MKSITQDLKFSGIYCIINIINNHRYVGSAKNIRQRLWKHRTLLRHQKHENRYLQNAWNKYGENNFDFYVLESCEENILLEREQYYVNLLNPEYNLMKEVLRPQLSEESRKKLSQTRKAKIASGEIKKTHNRHIFQYDLEGNFIAEYESIREAARVVNTVVSSIHRCLNGTYGQAKGYQWKYDKLETVNKFIKNTSKPYRSIYKVYNDQESYIFNGVKECAVFFNTHPANVLNAIKHNRNFKRKYKIEKLLP